MWRKCTIKNILSTQNFVFCESFFPTSSLSLKREDFVMALRRVCARPARSGGPAGRGRAPGTHRPRPPIAHSCGPGSAPGGSWRPQPWAPSGGGGAADGGRGLCARWPSGWAHAVIGGARRAAAAPALARGLVRGTGRGRLASVSPASPAACPRADPSQAALFPVFAASGFRDQTPDEAGLEPRVFLSLRRLGVVAEAGISFPAWPGCLRDLCRGSCPCPWRFAPGSRVALTVLGGGVGGVRAGPALSVRPMPHGATTRAVQAVSGATQSPPLTRGEEGRVSFNDDRTRPMGKDADFEDGSVLISGDKRGDTFGA